MNNKSKVSTDTKVLIILVILLIFCLGIVAGEYSMFYRAKKHGAVVGDYSGVSQWTECK